MNCICNKIESEIYKCTECGFSFCINCFFVDEMGSIIDLCKKCESEITHYECLCRENVKKGEQIHCKRCNNIYCKECIKTILHICNLNVDLEKLKNIKKSEEKHIMDLLEKEINKINI